MHSLYSPRARNPSSPVTEEKSKAQRGHKAERQCASRPSLRFQISGNKRCHPSPAHSTFPQQPRQLDPEHPARPMSIPLKNPPRTHHDPKMPTGYHERSF